MKKSKLFYIIIFIAQCLYTQEVGDIKVEEFKKEDLPLFYRLDYIPLKNRNITIEVLQIEILQEPLLIIDEENHTTELQLQTQCTNPKTKEQMQEYLYLHIPHYLNQELFDYTTSVGECDYKGKVKMLGRIWDFESTGGKTTLKANITPQEQAKDPMKEWYECDDESGDMCYIELACLLPKCYPKAEFSFPEMEEEYENKLKHCKNCK